MIVPRSLCPLIRTSTQDAFFDVVKGSNKVGRGGQPLPFGWNCSKGWDPATGLGTPLFPKLLKAAMGGTGPSPTTDLFQLQNRTLSIEAGH